MGNYIGKITQKGLRSNEVVVKQDLLKNASLVNVNLNMAGGEKSFDPFFYLVKNLVKGFSAGGSLVAYGYHWGHLDAMEELKKLEDELKRKEEKLEKLEDGGTGGNGGAGGHGGEKCYEMDPPFV